MAICGCFSGGVEWKRKDKVKEKEEAARNVSLKNVGLETLPAELDQSVKQSSQAGEKISTSFSIAATFNSKSKVKVMNHESPEAAYEGEDELEESQSLKRNLCDFEFPSSIANNSGEEENQLKNENSNYFSSSLDTTENLESKMEKEMIQSGHVSDPGIGKLEFWASPKLQRSCSNLETREVLKKLGDQISYSKSQSFEELSKLADKMSEDITNSPVISHCSADKVMLKKRSSSQILPSKSRRLWWKLFLWSHRNMQTMKSNPLYTVFNQQGGYSSDTLEPNRALELGKNKVDDSNNGYKKWSDFNGGISGLWPQNQWVALYAESSPFNRVDEWVKDLELQPPPPEQDHNTDEGNIIFPPSPVRSLAQLTSRPNNNLTEEVLHANSVIQSLNASSTVAHISGIGLKVIPAVSRFSSLRSVNLSNNLIVHITPGSLPKSLHTLNLSRNKISTIEGLRELTRLRVLDLSYNRISRIGHGISNCTLIKELYLAGNKISEVEGLHRLLKLAVLDLSFNKITTSKALGQLVANYNSLVALNLLGNPIQNNMGDDHLKKAVSGLLPKLAYLNKQPFKTQRAREVVMDSVAKAALGNSAWRSRKSVRKVSQGGSISSGGYRNGARSRSKTRSYHSSSLKPSSSSMAYSTRIAN